MFENVGGGFLKDCFAYVNAFTCRALRVKKCENCSFYKSKEQHLKDLSNLSEYAPLENYKKFFIKR